MAGELNSVQESIGWLDAADAQPMSLQNIVRSNANIKNWKKSVTIHR